VNLDSEDGSGFYDDDGDFSSFQRNQRLSSSARYTNKKQMTPTTSRYRWVTQALLTAWSYIAFVRNYKAELSPKNILRTACTYYITAVYF